MFRKNRYIPKARPRNYNPNYQRYETEKQNWIEHHPHATAQEYIEAMREIAQRCGI